jgi:DNA-binding IclR family transcriptional regulator
MTSVTYYRTHMAHERGVRVGALELNFEIIEALRDLEAAGVSEIAEHIEIPKTTAYDHLESLTELGYVVKENGEYRVGTKFLELAGYARRQMKVFQVAKPEVQKLARQTSEHANLMVEEHGNGIFLYKSKGENAVQLDTYAGHRVHLQTTALGKAILAYMPRERIEGILDEHGMPRITENTICDRAELSEEFEEIRDRGYATDHAERVEGMRCVAAPIQGQDGEAVAAISVSGPRNRLQGDRFREELPNKVLRAANVIEVNLTYS